jgi:hypothetical protein
LLPLLLVLLVQLKCWCGTFPPLHHLAHTSNAATIFLHPKFSTSHNNMKLFHYLS